MAISFELYLGYIGRRHIGSVHLLLHRLTGQHLGRPHLFQLLQHLLVDALVQERVRHIVDNIIDDGAVQIKLERQNILTD